ncbi:MAG: carboxypeptidase-like regulatory domain-containing protein [Vicinamibacterales bacterium]
MSDHALVSRRRVLAALLAASVACAAFGVSIRAQETAVHLSGLVTDRDQAPLEGARVELVEAETWAVTGTTTDSQGHFELEVPAGRYRTRLSYNELEIASEEAIELTAGMAMRLDISLQVKKPAK